ncbi:MAG: hypothetical protein QM632_04175 [Micrococcaceae bacterium]
MSDIVLGTILGGRYKVTREIIQTKDGDRIFDGEDQTLHRNVSITLSTKKTAGRVAEAARQIALGNTQSDLQIIDLGLEGDKAYVVTNDSRLQQIQSILLKDTSNVLSDKKSEEETDDEISNDDFDSLLATAVATKNESSKPSRSRRKTASESVKVSSKVSAAPIPTTSAKQQETSKPQALPQHKKVAKQRLTPRPTPKVQAQALPQAKATQQTQLVKQQSKVKQQPLQAKQQAPRTSQQVRNPQQQPKFIQQQTKVLPQNRITASPQRPTAPGQRSGVPSQRPAPQKQNQPTQKKSLFSGLSDSFKNLTTTGTVPSPAQQRPPQASAQSQTKAVTPQKAVSVSSAPKNEARDKALTSNTPDKQKNQRTQQATNTKKVSASPIPNNNSQKAKATSAAVTATPIPTRDNKPTRKPETPTQQRKVTQPQQQKKPQKDPKALLTGALGGLSTGLFASKQKNQQAPQHSAQHPQKTQQLTQNTKNSTANKPPAPKEKPKSQAATTAVNVAPTPVPKPKSSLPEKQDLQKNLKKLPATKVKSSVEKKKKASFSQTLKNLGHIKKQDLLADPITKNTPSIKPIKITTVSGAHIFDKSLYYEEEAKDQPPSYVMKVMGGVLAGAAVLGIGGTGIIYFANRDTNTTTTAQGATIGNTPQIVGVNHIPDAKTPSFETANNSSLKNISDDDEDTSWSTQTYQSANFDGKASSLPIEIDLQRKVPVSNVTIEKNDSQGGHVEVYASDSGTMAGAKKVGEANLDGTSVPVNLASVPSTQHIILNITSLPQNDNKFQLTILDVAVRGQ